MIISFAAFLESLQAKEAAILAEENVKHAPTIGDMYEGLTAVLPNLIICRTNSLLKMNGHPYIEPMGDNGRWGLFGSERRAPFRLLIELIWTRLSNQFGQIFPMDDSLAGAVIQGGARLIPGRETAVPVTPRANAREGIYEFPDQANGGVPYVGQSGNVPSRLQTHERSGRLDPGTQRMTEVPGGRTARERAEHARIQEITGGVPARQSDAVSNRRDPIGPRRRNDE